MLSDLTHGNRLAAGPALGVVLICLDPHAEHPPVVKYNVKKETDPPRWVSSWHLEHNLDRDGGDTMHVEIDCHDERGFDWACNDRSGSDIDSFLKFMLEVAVPES